MDWHDWLVLRGNEATSLAALSVVLTFLIRWLRKVRARTRASFARTIGEEVGRAMVPIVAGWEDKVDVIDRKLNAHMTATERRRLEDDERWAKTERLYKRLHQHMELEEGDGK